MKKTLFAITTLLLASAIAFAQPSIQSDKGVTNAFGDKASSNTDIAQGSWFVVFGTGLGPSTISVYTNGAPFPTDLSGSSVTFTPAAGGTPVQTRMYYALATKLCALLPSSTPAGDYDVKVTYNSQTSAAYRVKVVPRYFGFATQASNGQGPAQATYGGKDLNRFTTGNIAGWSTRPAKAGDVVVLWGTGIGADTASDVNGGTSGDQTTAAQVKVNIGGVDVTPAYAGRSNGSPGLDQVNFVVPASVTPDCFVSLYVTAGGRASNAGTLAVAQAGQSACSSSVYSAAQLTKLDNGGTLTIGSLNLTKTAITLSVPGFGSFASSSESASGSFVKMTISDVATSPFSLSHIGSCYVYHFQGNSSQIGSSTGTYLDAGSQLTLNGPNATNKAIPKSNGVYDVTLFQSGFGGITPDQGTPTIAQGTYKISGTGGADIGAFTASLDVPGAFTWTNQATLPDTIPRNASLPIQWTGGSTGSVAITGFGGNVIAGASAQDTTIDATVFTCVAQASAGNFTVPTSVLQQLPVVASGSTSATGSLIVTAVPDSSKGQGVFTLSGVDFADFSYAIGSMKSVGWN